MSTSNELVGYFGHVINPQSVDEFDDFRRGGLIVNADGLIEAVGELNELQAKYPKLSSIHDYGDRLIMPGMVDLHLHLPQVTQTGKSGQTLLGWLERYIFPAEARFADTEHATKIARWFFNELARNGTTLSVVFTTIHKAATDAAFVVAAETGSRVIMGKVLMDKNSPADLCETVPEALADSEELCKKWHGFDRSRLQYAFTPRFAVTSSVELLNGIGRLWAQYPGTYMHTHLAESEEECRFVQELFPESRSYLDVYEMHGLTGPNAIFAHAIHLDDQDMHELERSSSALAHCPSSNFFLKSGCFPFEKIRKKNVLFGLGSDVAAGPQMSLFGVMKDANYMQPGLWLEPAELFYHATLGGARAVNMDAVVGNFSTGKEADFIVVDPARKTGVVNNILKQSTNEILSALVFLGDDRVIDHTFVRGKCLFSSVNYGPVPPAQLSL